MHLLTSYHRTTRPSPRTFRRGDFTLTILLKLPFFGSINTMGTFRTIDIFQRRFDSKD